MDINEKAVLQKNIVDKHKNNSHGIFLLAPRIGKTKIAIDLIKEEKPERVLWVTPFAKLRDIDIPKEFIEWGAENYLKKTDIVCWSSLSKYLRYTEKYDKIILDEYQYITKENSKYLQAKNITALSGTHPKDIHKLKILQDLKLEILEKLDIEEAVEKGLIADYKIYIVETELDNITSNILSGTKDKPFYTTEKKQYEYLTKLVNKYRSKSLILKRMQFIYNSLSKEKVVAYLLKKFSGRKLVFCGSIEQSNRLSTYTYNSKTDSKNFDLFQKGKLDTLICVKTGGIGFTYRNVDHFIISQIDSDSRGESTQKLTRALLSQKDYKANIWIVCLNNTQDEIWLKAFLTNFDDSKVEYIRYINII